MSPKSALLITLLLQLARAANHTLFSAPPSDLPMKRVYIHGRPILVRQVNVTPLRKSYNTEVKMNRRKRCPGLFGGGGGAAAAPAAAAAPSYAAAAPAYAAAAPAYAYANAYAPSYALPPAQPRVIYPPVRIPFHAPAPVLAPPPPPPAAPILPPPVAASDAYREAPPEVPHPEYPLPECYTDDSNFMCCNNKLELYMKEAFNELKASRSDWTSCNIHQIAHKVQLRAEKEFDTNFEVVAGVGDYASKSHFYSNLICKIEREGKFILAYATPKPEEELDGDDGFGDGFGEEQDGLGAGFGEQNSKGGEYGNGRPSAGYDSSQTNNNYNPQTTPYSVPSARAYP